MQEITHNRFALTALRARLPAYMVPSFLDVVVEMPLLPSGKIDRKSLPPPTSALVDRASADMPPATPTEAAIAAVWATIFSVPVIGVEQNFFLDLGGHSLLAAQMTALRPTPVHARIAVQPKAWGTRISLVCSYNATYPSNAAYQLVVVDRSGRGRAGPGRPGGRFYAARTAGSASVHSKP